MVGDEKDGQLHASAPLTLRKVATQPVAKGEAPSPHTSVIPARAPGSRGDSCNETPCVPRSTQRLTVHNTVLG